MSSRRRRAQTRKTGPHSKPQATTPQNQPSGPNYTDGGTSTPTAIESGISKPAVIDDDLRFKTGKMGQLARFFAKTRAARDPFDQTVILPPLIFLFLERLYDLGRINAYSFGAGLIIPASVAGLWIGACLGDRGIFRAMLRGALVGAIEGAGSAAIAKETMTQSQALQNALNLMYINVAFFGAFSILSSLVGNIATDWQRRVAWRAFPAAVPASYTKLRSYYRKVLSWCFQLLVLTFSPENIARPLLNFFIYIAIYLLLWIAYGIDPFKAIASFPGN